MYTRVAHKVQPIRRTVVLKRVQPFMRLFAVSATLSLAACSTAATPTPAPSVAASAQSAATAALSSAVPAAALNVYAAASLKAALARVKETYEAAHKGTTLTVSTDSSAALETKIEQGAPADVFLSADTTNPRKLVDGGFASGGVVNFAGNFLTAIVPAANPAGITSPADLAKSGLKIIAAGDNVPITRYATQLVANLAKEPGYPTNFAVAYAANVVSKEDNVAALVAKVELGEGDAGIVYTTDAKASSKVRAISVPAAANVPATYGGVVVKASANLAAATAFLAWLASPAGEIVLASFGFQPAPE
jgi:molybdate transport system substrate-binding protein